MPKCILIFDAADEKKLEMTKPKQRLFLRLPKGRRIAATRKTLERLQQSIGGEIIETLVSNSLE